VDALVADGPSPDWHSKSLVEAVRNLSERIRKQWLWWSLTPPAPRTLAFADIVDADDVATGWHSAAETARLISMMTELHIGKLATAKASGKRVVGTIYKRRRADETGSKHQRAEARFDDVAGCLRTPTGGSSRQTIIIAEGESVRTRLLQPSEAARLMGLDDDYRLPKNYYEAYHLVGDGVAVPVVRFLAASIIESLLSLNHAPPAQKLATPL
jgi:DNA (cytosine-5)-methyltransferase 1